MHCHHEKIVVVDDEVAFVGGIDFTDPAGDRLDTSDHIPDRALGWHDAATCLHGPIVADVAAHFVQRRSEVAAETLPEPVSQPPAGTTSVQFVRTVPEGTYKFAELGEFTILQAYLRALRSARSPVYPENQFLWSSEVVDVLMDKLLAAPGRFPAARTAADPAQRRRGHHPRPTRPTDRGRRRPRQAARGHRRLVLRRQDRTAFTCTPGSASSTTPG